VDASTHGSTIPQRTHHTPVAVVAVPTNDPLNGASGRADTSGMDQRTMRLAFVGIGGFVGLLLVAVLMMSRSSATRPEEATTTQPQAVSTDAPISQASRAQAEARLQTALSVAVATFAEGGSYTGFDATVAEPYDPTTTWVDGAPPPSGAADAVYIVSAADLGVVLGTMSSSGEFLCVQQDGATTSYGVGTTWDEARAACTSPSWP
jgi:hypothetical protein